MSDVSITPMENGPYIVRGRVTVLDVDGNEYHVSERKTIAVAAADAAAAWVAAPATEPMLVWHLLTHTSGLTYGFYFVNPVDEAYRAAGFLLGLPEEYTLEEACERWASLPLLFEPGAEWNYSHSTDVVGRIVEVVSGQPLDEFFAERIFGPLGMSETRFTVSEEDAERLAFLYAFDPASASARPDPA